MASVVQLQILEDSLELTYTKENGEVIVINCAKDLDPRDIGQGLNTAPTMIALLETWAAEKKYELENLKAEYSSWWAQQDLAVRSMRGYSRGEERIKQAIMRKGGSLDRQYNIALAEKEYLFIKAILRGYYAKLDVLRTKDSTLRNSGEIPGGADNYINKYDFQFYGRKKIRKALPKPKEEINNG